ncbi:MAG: ABC transporter [Actinobacteria bacterium HGW-Actinobacteria-4]|nr:MAG: ABC transporter [Actinobacteria bacterium HGW-Actinobacteria-4]
MTTPAIHMTGLRKTYGSKHAVDGLDLTIKTGEVFALLGPNGAGKSTTVEILEGYRKRNAGDVTVLGVDPAHPTREWRERLGIMLQSTSSVTLLTAREAIAHTARLYPNPRNVDEVIAEVGLEEKADARANTLSGGQRRRLDVALAVIGRPELVFLDEPTTGFDPEARRQFWRLIETLRDGGTTILLTTHYLDEAEYLADRVAVIANGSLVALDTPKGLRRRAENSTVSWTDAAGHQSVATTTPTAVVRDLLAKHKGEIPDLEVRNPSLEDVYLELIGQADADLADAISQKAQA